MVWDEKLNCCKISKNCKTVKIKNRSSLTLQIFTCSKSTIETLKKGGKYVQS